MINFFVGRTEEKKILLKALNSHQGELVAVLGRRRVGKTYLIRSSYKGRIGFEMTGVQDSSLKEKLQNFTNRLNFHIDIRI